MSEIPEDVMVAAKKAYEDGYTEAQIAKEVRYVGRVALENERIGSDRAWNYGFVGPRAHQSSLD